MSVDTENQSLSQSNMCVVKKQKINQNEAVAVLKLWLMTQNEVNEEELKHVWKGLLCKANKHLSRCELVEKLSSISETLDLSLARQYFQVFLMAMRRAWIAIDYFNLDKFNLILGGIFCHMNFVLDKNRWDCELVNDFMGTMVQRTLMAVVRPRRMNSYFADMYLSDIHFFLPVPLDAFGRLIEIRLRLKRVKDNVFTCLLENDQNILKGNQEGKNVDKEKYVGSLGIMNRLLQLVTLPCTLQDNGAFLDKLCREFSRLYEQLAASGVMISLLGAIMPKIYSNVSTQQCLKVKSISIHETQAYSGSPTNIRHMNNAESNDQVSECEHNLNSEMRAGNAQQIESTLEGSLMHIFTENNGNGLAGSLEKEFNAEAEELQDSGDELNLNYASRYQDVINDVNKEDRLLVVYRDPGDTIMLDAMVISNREQRFEEADADLDNCTSPEPSLVAAVSPSNTGSKKRRRELISENGLNMSLSPACYHDSEEDIVCSDLLCEVSSPGRSAQKRAKRVRFSLKNNLVWRPHNPLPPESLRVPPSAAPRGSALKKGVPPGPICIMKKSPRKKPAPRQAVLVAVRKTARTTKSSSTTSMASTSSMVLRKHRSVAR